MSPSDIITIAAIAAILGAAIAYIVKAKKSGRKCIGCPCGKTGDCRCGCGNCCDKD